MVSDSLSLTGGEKSPPSPTYTESFERAFPYYLSIGMTPHQYWEEDPTLCQFYRQADELRLNRVNFEAWLQGAYVYEAIASLTPILHPFAKKGTKAKPYVSEPYPLTEKQKKQEKENKDRAVYEKGKRMMIALMNQDKGTKDGRRKS